MNEETSSPKRSGNTGMMVAILLVAIIPLIIIFALATQPNPNTYRYVISPGTQLATERGLAVTNPLPPSLTVNVGDSIEVVNNDSAPHTYSFLVLRPGETGRYTFRNIGVFTGACTIGDHTDVSITVVE
jgi:hypothetical protein